MVLEFRRDTAPYARRVQGRNTIDKFWVGKEMMDVDVQACKARVASIGIRRRRLASARPTVEVLKSVLNHGHAHPANLISLWSPSQAIIEYRKGQFAIDGRQWVV